MRLLFFSFLLVPVLSAQSDEPLSVEGKFAVHLDRSVGIVQLIGSGLGAGLSQIENQPREWGQGVRGYARRYASVEGFVIAQNVMAFGLDTAFHDDPRYFRSQKTGFFPRLGYAFSRSFVTHTDNGGLRPNTWRIVSNYGAGLLSNAWDPPRICTAGDALTRGTFGLGLDTASNIASEFWPDFKGFLKKTFHRK